MRRLVLVIALLLPSRVMATECITISWSARDFLTARTDAARAIGRTPDSLRVVSILFGTRVREGDVIQVVPRTCHRVTPGVEYFVSARCTAGSDCHWNWTKVEHTQGFEQFARERHTVSRPQLLKKLRAWQMRKLSTEELQRWLSTADARDSDGALRDSLALAVIEGIEDLLDFAVQAESCNPSDAVWLRKHGSSLFLERFRRLPEHETASAYEAWLGEQEDAENEWDPERLKGDLEQSLERARSWNHTIDCFLQTYRETPQ